jgi:hypothetical protein
MALNVADVGAMVRNVIIHRGLTCTVVSVTPSPSGWNIGVRTRTGGVHSFDVHDARPPAMRIAIHRYLEAAT